MYGRQLWVLAHIKQLQGMVVSDAGANGRQQVIRQTTFAELQDLNLVVVSQYLIHVDGHLDAVNFVGHNAQYIMCVLFIVV